MKKKRSVRRSRRLFKRGAYKKTILSNGLTIITENHPALQSVSMGVWVKAGTRHERPRETGISHFLEHMLFKGTEKRSALDIAVEIDRVGGEFNAFTTREYTCFHLLLLKKDLALGLEILSDILLHSKFDAEEMERERKVILQEISMVDESPEELVHDLYFELLYGKHGLGKPILGTETSVKRLRRGDLMRYFYKHYRPEQLIVSVSGNVSHQAVCKSMKALSKKQWPGRTQALGAATEASVGFGFEPAPSLRDGRWWVKRPTEQVHLVWGIEGPNYVSRDRITAAVLNMYLGGGMSSTLFQEIREKNGLAYTVYSNLSPFLDSGVFSVYAATSMKNAPLCVDLIEECVGKLGRELLTEDELQVVKENLKGTILLSSESSESRMQSIAMNEIFFGEYFEVDEVCRKIDEVQPADIRRLARKFLSKGKRSLLCMGPKPPKSVAAKLRPLFPKKFQK